MKTLTTKLLLIVACVLLFINLIVLISGGYWRLIYARDGYAYKINRITGKTYFLHGRTEKEVVSEKVQLSPKDYLKEAQRRGLIK